MKFFALGLGVLLGASLVAVAEAIAVTMSPTPVTWTAASCESGQWDITATATSTSTGQTYDSILFNLLLPQPDVTLSFPDLPPGPYIVTATSRRMSDGLMVGSSPQHVFGLGNPLPPPTPGPSPGPTPIPMPTPPPPQPTPPNPPDPPLPPGQPAARARNRSTGAAAAAAAPTVSMSVRRPSRLRVGCAALVIATPPDADSNWRAGFRVDGAEVASDSSAPYRIEVPVRTGSHRFSMVWTRKGRSGMLSAVTLEECRQGER